jgi:hypothetical protein
VIDFHNVCSISGVFGGKNSKEMLRESLTGSARELTGPQRTRRKKSGQQKCPERWERRAGPAL